MQLHTIAGQRSMSESSPIRIDRREALRRTALLLGGAISAPTRAGFLAGCEAPATNSAWVPRWMTADQGAVMGSLAEHILPATDTPGAQAAGVHRFIDTMLAEYYGAAERKQFVDGLEDVDARARSAGAKSFLRATPEQQLAVLTALDREAYPHSATASPVTRGEDSERGQTENATGAPKKADTSRLKTPAHSQHVCRTMQELAMLGYYTSEI